MNDYIMVTYNCQTGEKTERPFTESEIEQYKKDFFIFDEELNEQIEADKAAEKAALLDRLGITADQAKLLLS